MNDPHANNQAGADPDARCHNRNRKRWVRVEPVNGRLHASEAKVNGARINRIVRASQGPSPSLPLAALLPLDHRVCIQPFLAFGEAVGSGDVELVVVGHSLQNECCEQPTKFNREA